MKFSALVVAAMVITSVSAGKRKRIRGCSEGDDSNSGSVPPPELLESDGGPFQALGPTQEKPADDLNMNGTKKDLVCGPIVSQLALLLATTSDLYWDWRRIYVRYNRIERGDSLSPEEMGNHYASRNDDPEMQKIESKLDLLEKEHRAAWAKLVKKNCPIKSFQSMSPERVIKNGHLRQWQNGADKL
ncbi:hypothetical protein BASA61_002522 [Batrachochytrium salamandrivorans]|nr:hypothetical protein BASA61_002522 [Batrachochytrium salamandrivorans]